MAQVLSGLYDFTCPAISNAMAGGVVFKLDGSAMPGGARGTRVGNNVPGIALGNGGGGGSAEASLSAAAVLRGIAVEPSLEVGCSSVSKASSSDASDLLLLLCARLLAAAFSARLSLACAAATCAFASSC